MQITATKMEIRFVSTLTAEDEERYATWLLAAVAAVLDQTDLAYALSIRTTSAQLLQHNHHLKPSNRLSEPSRSEGAAPQPAALRKA